MRRKQGILRRLASSPLSRPAVVAAKLGSRFVLGLVQLAVGARWHALLIPVGDRSALPGRNDLNLKLPRERGDLLQAGGRQLALLILGCQHFGEETVDSLPDADGVVHAARSAAGDPGERRQLGQQ